MPDEPLECGLISNSNHPMHLDQMVKPLVKPCTIIKKRNKDFKRHQADKYKTMNVSYCCFVVTVIDSVLDV